MILVSSQGKIVAINKGPARFMQSLIVDNEILQAGVYHLMIDAAWNLESNFRMDFKNITIDICSPSLV